MNKETLTVETDKNGRIMYRNASGQLHNSHGPAVVHANGSKEHYINGKLHNPNGPAVIFADGDKWYCINGKRLTEAGFKAWQAEQAAPLHNTIVTIAGIKFIATSI